MSSLPSAFMATTPPCRCWPRATAAPRGFGPTCVMIALLAVLIRPPPCSSIRLIEPASILSGTSPGIAGYSRPTRLCWVQHGLQVGSTGRNDHGSGMLGSRETQAVRTCRHRVEGAQSEVDHDLADRLRGRSQDRRHLHAGTLDQWLVIRAARGRAP